MLPGSLDDWLDREWLLTNGRGGFACSTIIGCPTRREHGWMVWNVPGPQLDRWMLWSHAAENLHIDGRTTLLANFEFNSAIDPHGYRHLAQIELSLDDPMPTVTWTYKLDAATVSRSLCLPANEDIAIVRYRVEGRPESALKFSVWPMIAARPLNSLRRRSQGEMFQMTQDGPAIGLHYKPDERVAFVIMGRRIDSGPPVEFQPRGDWWYNFRYRREAERGLECSEDLMVPGAFHASGKGSIDWEMIGVGGTSEIREALRRISRLETSVARPPAKATVRINGNTTGADAGPPDPPVILRTLARQFVFRQPHVSGPPRIGVVAGYPWLEEYSRDACVSIPGLLLLHGRFEEARELLLQLALLRRDGALPSHISDEPAENDYVSADASLWFIYAVDAYLDAAGDRGPAVTELLKASLDIVRALIGGQRDGMRMDSDGLLLCEDAGRAATWMDARYAWHFITPRTGKPVEVNALWYHALRVLARRLPQLDRSAATECDALADKVRDSFQERFWNKSLAALHDVVRADSPDAAIRPNQIIAVSLANSPLTTAQQAAVVQLVQDRLLTPFGLRTLANDDPNYQGRYEGSIDAREHAAHQGSVYSWLLGPFIEAYLRVHNNTPRAKSDARGLLRPIIDHLTSSGAPMGVSELFDGDPPHRPRGSVTQAWSVGEIARAWALSAPDDSPAPFPLPPVSRPVAAATARHT